MNYKIISNSDMDTIELAQNIESEKFPNMVICMEGDLGSGKTLFTKAFAKSMGISENITSPTFNIIKEYDGMTLETGFADVCFINNKTNNTKNEKTRDSKERIGYGNRKTTWGKGSTSRGSRIYCCC